MKLNLDFHNWTDHRKTLVLSVLVGEEVTFNDKSAGAPSRPARPASW